MSRLQRANALLDAACKRAGIDPVAMRIQMAKTIKDAHERQENGPGFTRQPPIDMRSRLVDTAHLESKR